MHNIEVKHVAVGGYQKSAKEIHGLLHDVPCGTRERYGAVEVPC